MKKQILFGLEHTTIAKIRSVFLRYAQIQKAIIYGSRAKGTYRPGSDIDIALIGPNLNTDSLLKIENELDDLMLPYKIDLSLLQAIENRDLLDHISRNGKAFYERGDQLGK